MAAGVTMVTSTGLSSSERSHLLSILSKTFTDTEYCNDLTSDVVCLVLNPTRSDWLDSKKFQYVSHSRPDIKIISLEVLLANYEKWLNGEESTTNLLELSSMPIFDSLSVSISRLPEHLSSKITNLISKNGGTVFESMTSFTNILITTSSEGRRYEKAKEWSVPIVTPDWCFDSIERGAVLSHFYYKLSKVLGKGRRIDACDWEALREWNEKQEQKKMAEHALKLLQKKRKLEDGHDNDSGELENETKIESKADKEKDLKVSKVDKNGQLWRSIMGDIKVSNLNQLSTDGNWNLSQEEVQPSVSEAVELNTISVIDEDKKHLKKALFKNLVFKLHGFDKSETRILSKVICDYGGKVAEDDIAEDYLVLNSKLNEIPKSITSIVTELAIERCIFYNELVIDDFWSRPITVPSKLSPSTLLDKIGLVPNKDGKKKFQVSITGFKGIELSHIEKLLKLKFSNVIQLNEMFNKDCELLVYNDNLTKARIGENEKLKLSAKWGVKCIGTAKFLSLLSEE